MSRENVTRKPFLTIAGKYKIIVRMMTINTEITMFLIIFFLFMDLSKKIDVISHKRIINIGYNIIVNVNRPKEEEIINISHANILLLLSLRYFAIQIITSVKKHIIVKPLAFVENSIIIEDADIIPIETIAAFLLYIVLAVTYVIGTLNTPKIKAGSLIAHNPLPKILYEM